MATAWKQTVLHSYPHSVLAAVWAAVTILIDPVVEDDSSHDAFEPVLEPLHCLSLTNLVRRADLRLRSPALGDMFSWSCPVQAVSSNSG